MIEPNPETRLKVAYAKLQDKTGPRYTRQDFYRICDEVACQVGPEEVASILTAHAEYEQEQAVKEAELRYSALKFGTEVERRNLLARIEAANCAAELDLIRDVAESVLGAIDARRNEVEDELFARITDY